MAAKAGSGGRNRRYWAFLSYAHEDSKAAAKLHNMLERFRVPKALVGSPHPLGTIPRRLAPVFRDRQELAASSNLGREIKEALEVSNCFIVLCSPEAAKSRWVDQEIRDFKRLHGEDRVFAAILDGEPFSGDNETECFPPALRYRTGPDGEDTGEAAEPIAADLRVEGDGWRGGFLKLVAGMLDVGLDDLVQRDQQRRQKRMAWMAAASLAGMAVTSGLALFALDSRNTAREERREAEGLVGFMLGDLKGQLEPIGKLEALDQVGEKALAYYERQDRKDLSDDQLAQRSQALTLLGRIAIARGNSVGALERVSEAMRSTEELVERAPDNPRRLFDHAQNVFWMGELARDLGRLDRAEAAYREYQSLANRMVAIEPANPKWQMETLYAKENIGIILFYQRRFADASRELDASVPVMAALASRNPGSDEYQNELGNMLAWLGDARNNEGRYDLAIKAREQQIALLQKRLASGRSNVNMEQQLVIAHRALGRALADTGRPRSAAIQLRNGIRKAQLLIAGEPENATWKGTAAGLYLDLAENLLAVGLVRSARQEAQAGCALVEILRNQKAAISTWHTSQTTCYTMNARLALAEGAYPQSLGLARQALLSAQLEKSLEPIRDRYSVAAAYRLIGDIHDRIGDERAAREAWATGLAQLPKNVRERPREMRERAILLERMDQRDEARPLLEKLQKQGFRRIS